MGRGSRAVVSPRPGILAYSSASKQSTSSRTSTGSSTRRSPSPSTRSPSQSSVFSRFVTQSALEYSLAGIAETHQVITFVYLHRGGELMSASECPRNCYRVRVSLCLLSSILLLTHTFSIDRLIVSWVPQGAENLPYVSSSRE